MGLAVRIVVCDPSMGNVRSVVRALSRTAPAGAQVSVTREAADVARADVLVVPGQGSFGTFAKSIHETPGLRDAVLTHMSAGKRYLGICLGMQVLFESSDEAPGAKGLAVFRGHVKRLEPGIDPKTGAPYPLPHIGWNEVVRGGGRARHFYFAHSYAVVPAEASLITGMTHYGDANFVASIGRGRVPGVKSRPGRTQREGLALVAELLGD